MSSDIEEDFPLNGGSDRLAKLFEDNTLDDISFKFSLPKHPTSRLQKPAINPVPLKVIHAKTVEAFQMKIGGYKSEGKVGVAIIGNDEYFYYQLYMYRSDERKVSSAEISFQFNFLVQDHNYASFKDSLGIQWSIHFDKSSDLINFSKEIALARWRSTPSCQCKLIQEAFKGKTENVIKKDDNIKVNYKIYYLSPENTLQEEYSEKVLTAPANSPNWEANLIGSCLKSRRFVIMPSDQSESLVDLSLSHGVKLMMELEVDEISNKNVNNQSSSSLGIQNTSSKSVDKKEEAINLSERMSRIGYALPNLQILEKGNNHDVPDKINSLPQKPVTYIPSTSSMVAGGSICSSEIADVTVSSQFNMLFSEVRTSSSEIRMNLSKVNDKIDVLISKIDVPSELEPKKTSDVEKIKSIDGVLDKLSEQNNTIMSLLEKHSLSNFNSTINELIQLKKRNSELESLLEVAGSTSHILKDKVDELNMKISEMEKNTNNHGGKNICSQCSSGGGNKKIKELAENVRILEERNSELLHNLEELERQNRELNENSLSTIQGHSNQELSFQLRLLEKDKRIENLEREIDRLNLEVKKRCTRQSVEKEITEVAKALMNKAYKTLKSLSRDSCLIDHSFANALREMTRAYLENHFEQKCPSLFEHEECMRPMKDVPSRDDYEQHGNPQFPPENLLLPVPKPRNTKSLKPSFPNEPNNKTDTPLTKDELTGNSDVDVSNEKRPNQVISATADTIETVDIQPIPLPDFLICENFVNISDKIKNNNMPSSSMDGSTGEINDEASKELDVDLLRNDSNPSIETEPYLSPNKTSYSSNFYPPLIPTTPPPIIDDNSE